MICITTDYVERDLEWEAAQYAAAGIEFRALNLRNAQASELIRNCADADVLVVDQAKITAEVLERLPRLKLAIRHGDGYDNLDLTAATRLGIVCANEPGFWSREVAEQAFALALSAVLKLPLQAEIARTPRAGGEGWDLQRAMPIRSFGRLTAGLIGCGKIGSHALTLFRTVFERVLVHDSYIDRNEIEKLGGEAVSLERLLAEADVVSLHMPATETTTGMMDASRIASMKRGAVLINTARGPLVDTEAAADAVESGHLAGLALDTTNPEPLPAGHRLFSLPNVLITPHLGWYSENALQAMREQIVADVKSAAAGNIPASVVNPDVLDSPTLRIGRL